MMNYMSKLAKYADILCKKYPDILEKIEKPADEG